MYFDEDIWEWRYSDDNSLVKENHQNRPCGECGEYTTKEGHDACLGTLPNVLNACCGHGDESNAYIQFKNGSYLQGEKAIKEQENLRRMRK